MKVIQLLIIMLLFVACKSETSDNENDGIVKADKTAQQWLSLDGNDGMPHVVFVTGDEEYRSEEAMPQLARILSERHGFKCTVLFSQDPINPGIVDPNYLHNIPGLEMLASADLMVLFTRFRALPDGQMQHINDYLMRGKPVIGIRTATHAFNFDKEKSDSKFVHYGNYYDEEDEWNGGFGRLVMGEKWIAHHGKHGHQSTKGLIAPNANDHPILTSIGDGDVWGPTDVYEVRLPLPGDAQPLILGQVTERKGAYDENDPLLGMRPDDQELPAPITKKDKNGNEYLLDQNDPMMPVAWTKSYQLPKGKQGKCFATTMGSSTDLLTEGTRRLFVNAVYWLLDRNVPERADVNLVGNYSPSRFAFLKDEHWDEVEMRILDMSSK